MSTRESTRESNDLDPGNVIKATRFRPPTGGSELPTVRIPWTLSIVVAVLAATVWGLLDGAGRSGLVLDPDQAFAVDLTNALAEPTIIHWHGQIPDNAQDGVPDLPMPALMSRPA